MERLWSRGHEKVLWQWRLDSDGRPWCWMDRFVSRNLNQGICSRNH